MQLGPANVNAGFCHIVGALSRAEQVALLAEIRAVVERAPWFTPRMPRTGRAFSVRMSNAGVLGWVSDKYSGYRYQTMHPETGEAWPAIPSKLLEIWAKVAPGVKGPPEACLINCYGAGAKMGSHRDADEEELSAPVVSVSLGDDAIFHVGGLHRSDPKQRVVLRSGDVAVLGGGSRLAYHGIDRVLAGTSDLIPGGGRINLTLRRVTRFPVSP